MNGMAKNTVTLKGNLAHDPFFDYLSGRSADRDGPTPFMRFTLAVDRTLDRQPGVDHLLIVAYGQLALHDHAFLRQGSEILVDGWLRARKGYNDRGEPLRIVEVVAQEITFLRNIAWEEGEEAWSRIEEQQA